MPQPVSNEPKAIMAQAEDFAKDHLRECAAELIEWSDTAVLKDGKVRELARLCSEMVPHACEGLKLAQRLVEREALLFAACQSV